MSFYFFANKILLKFYLKQNKIIKTYEYTYWKLQVQYSVIGHEKNSGHFKSVNKSKLVNKSSHCHFVKTSQHSFQDSHGKFLCNIP